MQTPSPSTSSDVALVARLEIAYDGGGFHGWQVQPGLRTVQGDLVDRLVRLVPLEGLPPGAGRTDAGVHARGQVATLPLADPQLLGRLQRALPRMVPADMVVRSVRAEAPGFHARFSATARRYSYHLMDSRDPLLRRTHYQLPASRLDMDRVLEASAALIGEHDYASFCKAASLEVGKSICRVGRADWEREGDAWVFHIQADRFLHSMVRSIVGTLVEIGRGQRPVDAIPTILEARRRESAGHLAPAHGLCLEEVEYGSRPDPREAGDPS